MGVSGANGNNFHGNENYFPMEMALWMQCNNSHRPQMHKKSRTRNLFKVLAKPIPDLDQNQKRLFIKALIPCLGTKGINSCT